MRSPALDQHVGVLLLVGVPVAFALGGLGVGLLLIGDFAPRIAATALLSSLDSFILIAVPLFLLMSNILLRGGVGRDLFAAVQAWVGHWPGGLAVATVIGAVLTRAVITIAPKLDFVSRPSGERLSYAPTPWAAGSRSS